MSAKKTLVRRLVLRALRRHLPRGTMLPEPGDTLAEMGLDSLDRATLALALEEDLALEGPGRDVDRAWADVLAGDITLEGLIEKAEAMAGR